MKKILVAALALPLIALGGCSRVNYAVDVRNRTSEPISIELLATDPYGNVSWLADPIRLGPGDRGGIGPVTVDANRPAMLRADTPGNPGRPVKIEVRPGGMAVEVTQEGTTAMGLLHVNEVPR